jgi:UDP-2-acetamido-2,6-beta-L-arabino-hexul-4-ose reductase
MNDPVMKIAITGASGFIGQNVALALRETRQFDVVSIVRGSTDAEIAEALDGAAAILHLAGVNRPPSTDDFMPGNAGASEQLVAAIGNRAIPIWYASSAKADDETPYGSSKRAAEQILYDYGTQTGAPVAVARLPNVFGKWARPNYNSAVATFCHNITRGLPIRVDDPASPLTLVYIDDVVGAIMAWLDQPVSGPAFVNPVYETTVGEVSTLVQRFRTDREDHMIESVGTGLTRALYATYVSYLPLEEFSYGLVSHGDARGVFSEMLKTRTSGQFSYFTAHPGVTRGGHYHHTKTEKFLVVRGKARFKFRHMLTGQMHSIDTDGDVPTVVETVPGWTHDITNVGDDLLVSLLWANEVFDRDHPDTIAEKV